MGSRKRSYRRNRTAGLTHFGTGTEATNHNNSPTHVEAEAEPVPGTSSSADEPVQMTDDSVISHCHLTRPSTAEFLDACRVAAGCQTAAHTILPSKLRPAPAKEPEIALGACDMDDSGENIIVSIKKLSNLITSWSAHTCDVPQPKVFIDRRQGLCVTAKISCQACGYISGSTQMYSTIKKKRCPDAGSLKRGPDAGSLNDAIVLPVLKSKMGIADARYMLSCLNIHPPATSGLQRKVNILADSMVKINKETMASNQEYVRRVREMAGDGPKVNVEVDTAYNNRQQAGFEAATQTFCPLVEQDTSRHLVLSLKTANKLCTKRNCAHNDAKCKKNYGTGETISSSESKLLRKNLKSVAKKGILKVKSVTSDASSQVQKCIRDYSSETKQNIQHYKCFVHKLRNLQKKIRNVKLTTKFVDCDKDVYSLKLSISVRARVRLELTRIKRNFKSTADFINQSQIAISNILPCFSGKHANCRTCSLVCTAHLESYNTSYLPYGKHLGLNSVDMTRLKNILVSSFSPENLEAVSRLATTNSSESLHHRVFSYAPKNTIWCRNFTSICHSACHSSSLGSGASSLAVAAKIGLKYRATDPFVKQMVRLDLIARYHSRRKKSNQYKKARYLARKQKSR